MALAWAEKSISMLVQKTEEQENRSRRDNIRIIGLKEGIEGWQPTAFFEFWLPSVLGLETKQGKMKMDRAQRTPGRPRADNAKPCTVVIKLHNYTDRMKILAAFKSKQPMAHDGEAFVIRPDFTASVIQQRRCFSGVCNQLIKRNIWFRMAFPATLTFTHGSNNYVFTIAEEALELLDSWGPAV